MRVSASWIEIFFNALLGLIVRLNKTWFTAQMFVSWFLFTDIWVAGSNYSKHQMEIEWGSQSIAHWNNSMARQYMIMFDNSWAK